MANSAIDISEVREQLKVLFDTVDGARGAEEYMPKNVQTGQMPFFLISPGAATHQRAAGNFHRADRGWRITLLVAKDGEGAYGDTQKALEPFFERVEDLMHGNMRLDALDGQVYYAQIVEDTGEALIEVPKRSGNWYLGAEWLVMVTTNRRITAGE